MEREAPSSVILHVDLDCFYAAVEHVRLGIPPEKPLAVQQWEGLIAVNYAARAAGVVRHDRVSEALRKCPDLHLVHVETIGNDQWTAAAARRDTSKVSLERYRQASRCVFEIFHQHADICERASIDEAYLDVTKKVEFLVKESCNWENELWRLVGIEEKSGMIVENGPIEICDPISRRLLSGAIIAERIRTDVRTKLGYTCSVGIATNKLLAKIASARHKPDRQTLISPGAVADLMDALPLKKVKLLGGKIGEELSEKWSCKTAGDAQKVPLNSLVMLFGDRLGNYVYRAVRGVHEDKVQEKQTTKSMLAAKSFQATQDLSVIRKWLGVLAEELSIRMLRDARENHRQPYTLQLYYRSGLSRQMGDHSKSCAMPHAVTQLLASACFSTPRTAASKQQANETTGFSKKFEEKIVMESGPPSKEECESHESEPTEVLRSTEQGETSGKILLSTKECGVLHPGLRKTSDEEDGSSTDIDIRLTDETTKDLSKLLQQASFQLFHRIEDAFPCTRLAIAASGFQDAPVQGSQSIQHFFGNAFQGTKLASLKPCPSVQELVGVDKPLDKPRGMLRYVNNSSSGLKKPEVISCSNNEAQCCLMKNKEGSHAEFSNDDQLSRTDGCGGSIFQSENLSLKDTSYSPTSKSALGIEDSDVFSEEPFCQQGLPSMTQIDVNCHIDFKGINVEEQRRILEEIYTARSAGKGSTMSRQDKGVHHQERQVTKRRKFMYSKSTNKSGQPSLSKYFHSSDASQDV